MIDMKDYSKDILDDMYNTIIKGQVKLPPSRVNVTCIKTVVNKMLEYYQSVEDYDKCAKLTEISDELTSNGYEHD